MPHEPALIRSSDFSKTKRLAFKAIKEKGGICGFSSFFQF
jgi:hypothetical protein